MSRAFTHFSSSLAVTACLFASSVPTAVHAQSSEPSRPRILQNIDESKLARLAGNTRPEVKTANDRGAVSADLALEHMLLLLHRSPEQERELQSLIEQLHDPRSPNFHQWLTAAQFGERFGVAQQDVEVVSLWLQSHGFRVNVIYPNRMLVDFSGTAEQVRQAFHTEIHQLQVNNVSHIANIRDPQVPEALAPVLAGIVSLHDFKPRPMVRMHHDYTFSNALAGTVYTVVPADLAKIYNFNPVFSSGITGQGQTIVVVEDTNLYSTSDWDTFRSTFGLSSYAAPPVSQTHPAPPSGPNNCGDPGVNADDGEAALDAEFATAAAPSAAIQVASCSGTSTTFGGLFAIQNLINQSPTPPPIISVSYGECETVNGATANATYYTAFQQAVAEGVSVFVASGDAGAAGCDQNQSAATNGIAVSGYASTPYNVAVGGTDFGDTYAGSNGSYWNSSNTTNFESARSYVPEIPWNDSCAGALFAGYEGYPVSGSGSLCNYAGGILSSLLGTTTTAAGSGGPSGCATGAPAIGNIAGGTCAGYPKPSWQSVAGNPNDSVRDIPDVSLFAANGLWSHYYLFCYSDTANGGAACTGAPSGWTGAGGTSFGAPIMAGVQALINQKTGSRQGNPNLTLYSLAATEYGSTGNPSCNSTLGNAASSSCIFYDVTLGDMAVDCTTTPNCFDTADGTGVLSTSNSAYQPAFTATTGWDFATGIGTINVANLVSNWPGSASPNFSLSASPGTVTVTQGAASGSTITVSPVNGFSGSVTLSASGLPSGVTAGFSINPATTSSTLTLSASATAATGTATLTITGTSGSLTQTTSVALTVNPRPDFSLSASPTTVTITQGTASGSTISVSPLNGFAGTVALSASGLPSGVTANFNPTSTSTTSALTLSASATAAIGTFTVTVTGMSGSLTHTTSVNLTVNAAAPPPDFSLSASPGTVTIMQGTAGGSTITVSPVNGFSGSVTLSASGLPTGMTAGFATNPATTTSALTLTASTTAAIGTVTVTISGKSGSLTHTTSVTLTVNPAVKPDFALSASPTTLTIARGSSGKSTITVSPLNGFSGPVTLSDSGLPKGLSASFSPDPATTTTTLALKPSKAAATGTFTVTIKGVSGALSHTITISVTITR